MKNNKNYSPQVKRDVVKFEKAKQFRLSQVKTQSLSLLKMLIYVVDGTILNLFSNLFHGGKLGSAQSSMVVNVHDVIFIGRSPLGMRTYTSPGWGNKIPQFCENLKMF